MTRRAMGRAGLRSLAWTILAAGCLSAGGCKPQPPTISVSDVSLASIGREGVGLVVDLQVYNPNGFAMKVKSVSAELAAGGSVLARATAVEPIPVLPAKGRAEVSARLNLSLSTMLAAASELGKDRSLDYRLTGRCVFDAAGADMPVPIAASGRLALVQMLRWKFKKGEVDVGGEKPVTLVFDVTNPNAFAVPMAALSGEVSVNGQRLATVEASAVRQIGPGETVEVRVGVAILKDGFAKVLAAGAGGAALDFQPRVRLVRPVSLTVQAVSPK